MTDHEKDDFLAHYGVIGMKWGVHREKTTGTPYHYVSSKTKSLTKKASKTGSKEDQRKAKRSADLDKKLEDLVRKMPKKKAALKIFLAGTFATKTYETAKATGFDRATSALIAAGTSWMGGAVGNMIANSTLRSRYVNQK